VRSPELAAHLAECAACARLAGELTRFDALLRRALEVPVPAAGIRAPLRAHRPRALYALAASALLAVVLGATLWAAYPRAALAHAIVGHMAHEPQSWELTDVPVPPAALAYVLARSGVALKSGMPLVTYAHSCWFRGWFVPHLVVQGSHGPVTVLVLRHEQVARPTPIDEEGYRGVLVSAGGRGAFALLARDAATVADVDALAARVAAAVRFAD
jgi:hypothetical protein